MTSWNGRRPKWTHHRRIYEEYGLQSIRIPGFSGDPTKLVQSAPWRPSHRRAEPSARFRFAVLTEGCSPDAQLETYLCRRRACGIPPPVLEPSMRPSTRSALRGTDAPNGCVSQGYMLGDGPARQRPSVGCLIPRQTDAVAPPVWISIDKLLEDAQRDCRRSQERLLVTPPVAFPQASRSRSGKASYSPLCTYVRDRGRFSRVKDRRMVGLRLSMESSFSTSPMRGKTPLADRANAAMSRPAARRAGLRLQTRPNARVVYVRRPARPPSTISLCQPSASGGRISPSPPVRIRSAIETAACRDGGARPRTCARSDSTRLARCPKTASNTSWSNTSFPRADPHLRRLCRRVPRSSITISTPPCVPTSRDSGTMNAQAKSAHARPSSPPSSASSVISHQHEDADPDR